MRFVQNHGQQLHNLELAGSLCRLHVLYLDFLVWLGLAWLVSDAIFFVSWDGGWWWLGGSSCVVVAATCLNLLLLSGKEGV